MIEPFLRAQLEPVAQRFRRYLLARDLAITWAAAALLASIFLFVHRFTGWSSPWTLPLIAGAGGLAALLVWRGYRHWQPDYHQIALQIEQSHPELHALLLTAVEQRFDPATGKYHYLQERVIREAILESLHANWRDAVSQPRLLGSQFLQVGAFVLLLIALSGLLVQERDGSHLAHLRNVHVTPGDTSLELGSGLAVLARFEGNLPPEVTLVIRADAQPERRIQMVKSLADPLFGSSLPEVRSDLTYYIEHSGQRTRDFFVRVFEHPRLERADAKITFPEYTSLPERTIENTRRISAVEGATLALSLQLNKPVASARLIARDKSVLTLTAQTNRASALLPPFVLQASQTYNLVLVDAAGRTNKAPDQFVIEALPNRAPELKFVSPRGDQRVSPLEEISFQAEVWDDFGLQDYGITYTLAGSKPQSISLGNPAPAREKRAFNHLLYLEDLDAQPDQLLSYYLWADDIGPDGQLRRTASDMFFAEVRPFEEIFRQGQAPSGSGSEEGQSEGSESMRLAEIQKQIISATWKLQREHAGQPAQKPRPISNYAQDIKTVEQAQQEALNQARSSQAQAEDPQLKLLWNSVEAEMQTAAGHLGKALKSPEPLPEALAAEQAAYQALLRLASREYQVARGQQRGGGGNQRNQRQLDQLDLSETDNNYETQRQASAARQNPEQREQLQVLNRLKELAQRQQDLNERLKELQAALREAKSEAEREEIARRLKRLREEEQQMLADVDELLQRMDRPENQSRMAEARQQLEQTRDQVQRASDLMEKEAVSQALSAGTRAQRELQDLRDDFRQQNSAQFAEDMRQMRSAARELAQTEEQISQKLESLASNNRKSLSDSGQTEKLLEQLASQSQNITNLLDQMRHVSQEAEPAEPLLSKQLQDTLRQTSQGTVEQDLKQTSQLLQLSFLDEARQFENRARQQIEDLKQGVERAAESVLGDETQALRLARNELDELARQIDEEIARSNPSSAQASADQSRENERDGNPPDGQSPGNNQQQGNQQQAANSQSPPGQSQGSQGQQAQADSDQQPGAPSESAQQGQGETAANQQPGGRDGRPRQQASLSGQRSQGSPSGADGGGIEDQIASGRGGGGATGPLTGEDFLEWSDRLRDVEEMLDFPDLRNEVAGIRERARNMRLEFKRHSKSPQWDLVRIQIADPMSDVRDRISEELARRESKDSLVPIDRDPVPKRFSDLVRRYYEDLGSSPRPAP
jgi:hypothetical protein